MLRATVILCTYNPKKEILARTIEGLKRQSLNTDVWELVLVDNNSSNSFQKDLDLSWHTNSKIIIEKQQGLTHARIAGMKNATSDIYIFVDDDNVLDSNYLTNAIKIGDTHSFLGAWGGKSVGDFEIEPPKWFTQKHYEMLAVRDVKRDIWSNKYFDNSTNPIGAGLVIRSNVGKAYIEAQEDGNNQPILDRNGNSLLSGGDNDIVFTAINLGYGSGCFKKLRLTHIIPKDRLTKPYIIKLTESIALSNVLLYYKYGLTYDLPVRPKGRITDILYYFQKKRMNPLKRALIDAEVNGILKGKTILKSFDA